MSAAENDFDAAMIYVDQRLDDMRRNDPEIGYFDIGKYIIDWWYYRDAEGQLAYRIFERGAERGEVKALIAQADLLDIGNLVERDKAKAVELYERAIGLDDSGRANHLYGEHFMADEAVEDRYAKALAQYEASIAKGYNIDLINIGHLYFHGYGVEQDYATSLDYTKRGLEFIESSGFDEFSTAFAYSNMGEYYFSGLGVDKDFAKSLAYYMKAEEKGGRGARVAQYFLGEHYRQGLEVEQDFDRALEYFKRGAEAGEYEATFALGRAYELGEGVAPDPLIARTFYFKAMDGGDHRAAERLMIMAENGPNWHPDDAYRYCLKAVVLDTRPHSTASVEDCNNLKRFVAGPLSKKILIEVTEGDK